MDSRKLSAVPWGRVPCARHIPGVPAPEGVGRPEKAEVTAEVMAQVTGTEGGPPEAVGVIPVLLERVQHRMELVVTCPQLA